MAVADELAVAPRSETNMVPGLRPVGGDGEALRARGNELYGPVEPFGRKRNHGGAGRHHTLRAKRATDIVADDTNLFRLDAEPLRHAVLQPINELARLI